jgi:tRNA threonylcarbamoyladenosine biosynthesis protein TsaB
VTLLLALDTSTRVASVAVHDGEQILAETTWLAGREHSSRLLVEADAALARIGRTPSDLTGLVVAHGPGSFTGVRVAISVAKGMAAALSLPLWGVSTLDVVAAQAGAVDGPVRAVLEAGRGRVATACYVVGRCVEAPRLATLAELVELLTEPALVIGELSAEARAALAKRSDVRLASAALSMRRAGLLAELGQHRRLSGDPGNPANVDAAYIS